MKDNFEWWRTLKGRIGSRNMWGIDKNIQMYNSGDYWINVGIIRLMSYYAKLPCKNNAFKFAVLLLKVLWNAFFIYLITLETAQNLPSFCFWTDSSWTKLSSRISNFRIYYPPTASFFSLILGVNQLAHHLHNYHSNLSRCHLSRRWFHFSAKD